MHTQTSKTATNRILVHLDDAVAESGRLTTIGSWRVRCCSKRSRSSPGKTRRREPSNWSRKPFRHWTRRTIRAG